MTLSIRSIPLAPRRSRLPSERNAASYTRISVERAAATEVVVSGEQGAAGLPRKVTLRSGWYLIST